MLAAFATTASASITTYTDRATWRTAMNPNSSTGNVIDDLDNGWDGGSAASVDRGAYTVLKSGIAVFPNDNWNTDVNTTRYVRCMVQANAPGQPKQDCVFTFAAPITGFVFDFNPQSSDTGRTINVALNNAAGTTSYVLPLSNTTTTFGLVSTVSFTSVTLSTASATAWHGVDNLEFAPTAPTVSSVSSATGSVAGNTSVTIAGFGFNVVGGPPAVTFDGTAATNVTVNDYTSITATTPAHAAGAVSVLVTPPGTAGANAANSLFTYLSAGRTPTFGTPTPTADGYTVQISNYDANWQWAGTATAGGSVSVSNTGLATVTGVAAGTSSTATITSTRSGYADGSDTVAATSLIAGRTPTFGSATRTADGFAVQIGNYDANWQWAGTATASGNVNVSGTGLVTVTGVAPGTSSTATITTTRSGYVGGSGTTSATSLNAARTPAFDTPTATADGFTVQIANYDASWQWTGTATAGSVNVSGTGLVTVTGLAASTSSIATITTARTGYADGVGTVTGTSQALPILDSPSPEPVAAAPAPGTTQAQDAPVASPLSSAPVPVPAAPVARVQMVNPDAPLGPVMRVRPPAPGVLRVVGVSLQGAAMEQQASPRVMCTGHRRVFTGGSVAVECHLNARGKAARDAGTLRLAVRVSFTDRHTGATSVLARGVTRVRASGPVRRAVTG